MNITFREYKDEDRSLLHELVQELEEYVKTLDPLRRVINSPGFTELSLNETLENVKKYHGKILFAVSENSIVGYAVGVIWKQSEKNILEIGPHKLGEVLDIYLRSEFRGKGIGRKMIRMMENYFKNENCDSMWISVFAPNTNAHEMYKKCGFKDREIGMLKQL